MVACFSLKWDCQWCLCLNLFPQKEHPHAGSLPHSILWCLYNDFLQWYCLPHCMHIQRLSGGTEKKIKILATFFKCRLHKNFKHFTSQITCKKNSSFFSRLNDSGLPEYLYWMFKTSIDPFFITIHFISPSFIKFNCINDTFLIN